MSRALFWLYVERLGFAGVLLLAFCLPLTTSPAEILFPVCAAITVVTPSLRRRLRALLSQPTVQALCGLFLVLCIGSLYTEASVFEVVSLIKKYSRYVVGIFLFPYFINDNRRELTLNAFLLAIGVTVVMAYAKVYGGLPVGEHFKDGSVFKDHIQTSFCLLVGLIILSYRWLYQTEWRQLHLVAIGAIVFQLFFLSSGRSGYVLFALLAVIGLLKRYRWRGLFLGMAAVAVMSLSLYQFSSIFHFRVESTQQEITKYQEGDSYTSTGERFSFLKQSLKLVRERPLLGSGTGSFLRVYQRMEPVSAHWTENPHNEYLHLTVQVGILGFLALIAVFWAPWYQSAGWDEGPRFLIRALVLLVAMGCTINSWLLDTTEGHTYVFMLAVLCGVKRQPKPVPSSTTAQSPPVLEPH